MNCMDVDYIKINLLLRKKALKKQILLVDYMIIGCKA